MAIAETASASINNSNNVSPQTSGLFTPATNDLSLILGGITDTVVVPVVTDTQSVVYSLLVDQLWGTSSAHKMFIAIGTTLWANTANTTYSVATASDAGSGAIVFGRRISGGRASIDRHRQFGFGTGAASTTPTVVLPMPVNPANAVFGAVFNVTATAATVTPPASWSEILDVGHATPTMGGEYAIRLTGETGSTITWGSTSSTIWGAVVVEIYEAAQPSKIPLVVHHRNQLMGDD